METETDTPELLPGERTNMPEREAVPRTVTTASAFSGKPLSPKGKDETAKQREDR